MLKPSFLLIILLMVGSVMAQKVDNSTNLFWGDQAISLSKVKKKSALLDRLCDNENLMVGTNTCIGVGTNSSSTNTNIGLGVVGQYALSEQVSVGGIVKYQRNGSSFESGTFSSSTTSNSVMFCPYVSYYPSNICSEPNPTVKPFVRFQAGIGAGNSVSESSGTETVTGRTRFKTDVGIGATVNVKDNLAFNVWSELAGFTRVTDRFRDSDVTSSSNNLNFGLNKPTAAVEVFRRF